MFEVKYRKHSGRHSTMQYVLMNDKIYSRENALVDIEDRAYQFGDGIYEAIRVYNGSSFMMDEHMSRLARSAKEIQLNLSFSIEELKNRLKELISLNALKDGIIYLQISRGTAPRLHDFPVPAVPAQLIAYTKKLERPTTLLKNGIHTILTEDIRWLRCDIKSLNLLGNVLAKQKAVDAKCYEAILHRGQVITEGSSTNFFIVQDGILYTHPANNLILNGITRVKVLELCDTLKVGVEEKSFTIDQCLQADEAFITSTTNEVMPVIKVNDQEIGPGIPGPITVMLQQAFADLF
jgi:D-alanine transaminase